METGDNYDAACCAALVAEQGKDSDNLNDQKRSQLRHEALNWLQAYLDL
jgi:hypothetical protein